MKHMKKLTKVALAASLLATTAIAAEGDSPLAKEDRSRLDSLVTKVQKITSKAGLSMGGRFESRGFSSKIEGDTLVNQGDRTREDIMSTTLDLEMRARPLDAVSGTLVLRLHQDWRNMFAASATPLQTRWLSIDGNIKKVFFYSAGDFKAKISPYTLWAPTPSIDFEPEIFARQREDVMHEVFAGDNNRVLQGANLAFRASLLPVFDELTISATGARTRKGGLEVEHGLFSPSALDASLMDRYLFAGNLDMGIRKDLGLGFTYLLANDAKATYSKGLDHEADAAAHKNWVISLRGKAGTGFVEAIDVEKIRVKLSGEFALSNDRDSVELKVESIDSSGAENDTTFSVSDKNVAGMGLNFAADIAVGLGDAGRLGLKAGYTLNNEKFRNEAAQSPVFWRNSIINTEAMSSEEAVRLQYSPFNALYKHVYHFAPSGDNANKLGYHKMPINKIAWTRAVFTGEELRKAMGIKGFYDLETYRKGYLTEVLNEGKSNQRTLYHFLDGLYDIDLMPIMTLGQATPNRAGIDAELSGVFVDSAINFSGLFKSMQQTKADKIEVVDGALENLEAGFGDDDIIGESSFTTGTTAGTGTFSATKELAKTKYLQLGGGLSMDVAKFGNWFPHPIILSGSYKLTNVNGQYGVIKETLNSDDPATISRVEIKAQDYKKAINLLNAGLYFKFYKKAAILGGFQQLKTTNDYTDVTRTMSNWAAGLEFKVTEGGTVTASYGNVKNAIDVDGDKDEITQKQMDLHLTVKF